MPDARLPSLSKSESEENRISEIRNSLWRPKSTLNRSEIERKLEKWAHKQASFEVVHEIEEDIIEVRVRRESSPFATAAWIK